MSGKLSAIALLCAFTALFGVSCTSGGGESPVSSPAPTAIPSPSPSVVPPTPAPTPPPVTTDIPEPEGEPHSATPEPFVTDMPEVQPVPVSSGTPEPVAATKAPIAVSKEVFTQTFTEVEKLIFQLNDIVKRKDFSAWKGFLDPAYAEYMSDPAVLEEKNKSPTLKRLGIVLKSLEDYFRHVVVPSRANVRLDDLVFLSETEVEAIMMSGTRRITVYRLIKIDGRWLIGLY